MGAVPPAIAWAHAALLESTPRDGEVVATSPPAAVLRFSSRIEKGLTRAILTGADGRTTALAVEPDRAEDPPDRVSIPLPSLAPGAYRLSYRVLAADGHSTPGQIRFTVQGSGGAAR
jgi:methionine-rich copper-binding protein CopC